MTHVGDSNSQIRNPKDHAQVDLAICAALRPHTMTPLSRLRLMSAIGLKPNHGPQVDKALQRLRKQGLVRYVAGEESSGWVYITPPALQNRFAP